MTNLSVSDALAAPLGPPDSTDGLEAVARLLHAATHGEQSARSLLLVGRALSARARETREDVRRELSSATQLVEIGCANPTLESFMALCEVLDALVPTVADEADWLLCRHAPEIAAIHPQLAARFPAAQPAVSLSEIALTPSERRSHRESEQAFRIISSISRLVIAAQRECPSLAAAPLTLWWRDLDLADRPTLVTFRYLDRWINRALVPVLLVGELSQVIRPDLPRAPAADAVFGWRAHRERLVATIQSDFAGVTQQLQPSPAGDRPRKPALVDPQSSDEPPAGPIAAALAALARGDREEGCMQALFAIRHAVFNLNLEAVIMLGSAIVTALPDGAPTQLDGARLSAEQERLAAQEYSVALEFTLGRLDRARDVLTATWKAIALAHTFLEDHEVAIGCYERALAIADDPTMQAQLRMYLGLLTGKRLFDIAAAQDHLQEGLRAVDGATDPAALIERGWLMNVSALMAFQTKRHRDAMKLVRGAFDLMGPLTSGEAVHLKINVLSNISVLLEATGNVDQALEVWLQFARFPDGGSDVFAKHYFFREGGLRRKTGDLEGAMSCYEQSYDKALQIADPYHAEIAARSCGYVAHARAKYADAARWYGLSAELLECTGDYDPLPEVLLAAALSTLRDGRSDAARELVERAAAISERADGAGAATIDVARSALGDPAGSDGEQWEHDVIVAPSTKLNRPFTLISVPVAGRRAA